jgi:AcrR family transcriptional regulator
MDAARDLLVELGPDGLTVDAVVARSGVAKSTVYRHWKTRDDLVADVFADCMPDLQPGADDLGAEASLRDMAHQMARSLADPQWQRLLPAMILLKTQSDAMAHLNEEMKVAQQDLVTDVLRRCVDEGVLDPVVLKDPERTGLLLVGPMLAVALVDGEGLDEPFVDEIVDRFIRGYAPTG